MDYLLDIMIEYKKYKTKLHYFFSECIGGDVSSIIDDLKGLIEKPVKKYNRRDWQSVYYILSLKGSKQHDIHNGKK